MTTVIKKGSSPKTVREKYKKHKSQGHKENIKRFCGVITLKEDPVKLQKQWRNEWE